MRLGQGGHLHLQLEMGDLTTAAAARCTALESRRFDLLASGEAMEALVPLVVAQDQSQAFKEVVVDVINKAGGRPKASMVSASASGTAGNVGRDVVVFVAANGVAAKAVSTALYLATPGRDTIHLVRCMDEKQCKTYPEHLPQLTLR